MSAISPKKNANIVPDPHPAAAYLLGGHSRMMRGWLFDCRDYPDAGNRARADLMVTLNEMDTAVMVLGTEIESVIRDAVRNAIRTIKDYGDPENDIDSSIHYARVLRSEVNRAFTPAHRLRTWYDLGQAIGRYQLAARATEYGESLPDFGFVLDAVRVVYEKRGSEIPLLKTLMELEPQSSSICARQLLQRALDANDYAFYPSEMDRSVARILMRDLHYRLYTQFTKLTRQTPLTNLQERLLRAVHEKPLTADNLEDRLNVDRKRLYRDGINPLRAMGRLKNERRLGGYYDPLYPPGNI